MNPKVSVIMPLYNAEKYVEKTINSILSQTFSDFELLIIDDCPTDGTLAVISLIDDSRIRVIHNETNKGIAFSRNVGLQNARGEYIALMDDDDLASEDRFEKEVEYLDNHSDIDVVGGSMVLIDENDNEITMRTPMIANPDIIWADILFQCPMTNSSAMFRRRIVSDYNIRYHDNMYGMEDYRFWTEVSNVAKIYNFDNVFLKWRVTDRSETTKVQTLKEKERRDKFAEIQIHALKSRDYEFSEQELKLFTYIFNENKDAECKDLISAYALTRKLYLQTKLKHNDKSEAMLYTARNRYLQVAMREKIQLNHALGKKGFGSTEQLEKSPLVSVIIPTHNRADLLERSVLSVLRQTYNNIEVIIIDDGSTDSTREVTRKICEKETNVFCYHLEENKGPAIARNYGVAKANGTYVAFHDDDDEWHVDKLDIQMGKMLSEQSIDMTFAQMARYRDNTLLYIVDRDLEWERIRGQFLQKILLVNYVGAPTIVIKKEAFQKLGGFEESISAIEDWEFAIKAAIYLKVEFIPTPLIDVHVSKASVSRDLDAHLNAWLFIYKKYHKYADDRDLYIRKMFTELIDNCYGEATVDNKSSMIERVKHELTPDIIKEPMLIDYLLSKESEMYVSENQRLMRYKQVSITLMDPRKTIAKWLASKGYTKVAIYGIGRLGKALIDRLNDTDIVVSGMIDRTKGVYLGKQIMNLSEFKNNCGETQVVIITPLYEADRIGKTIFETCGISWMSIEDLLLD